METKGRINHRFMNKPMKLRSCSEQLVFFITCSFPRCENYLQTGLLFDNLHPPLLNSNTSVPSPFITITFSFVTQTQCQPPLPLTPCHQSLGDEHPMTSSLSRIQVTAPALAAAAAAEAAASAEQLQQQ